METPVEYAVLPPGRALAALSAGRQMCVPQGDAFRPPATTESPPPPSRNVTRGEILVVGRESQGGFVSGEAHQLTSAPARLLVLGNLGHGGAN